ncbi:MAG TPA: energy transducer TonB [Bryobacteraceae bacterium]|jgi:TonB family protein|nr:energy transducer TonB [Bryobacteraceae bacterium]
MKKLLLVTCLCNWIVGIAPTMLASTNPAAQQALTTAAQQANFFRDQASSLQLDVDFVAQIKIPVRGHLTLKREASDRWWRKIVLGQFEQTEVRNRDTLYIQRNTPFTPARVKELVSLLGFAEDSEGLHAKKLKQQVENGIETTCLQVERENVRGKSHELCINSATHEILSDDWLEAPDIRRSQQYSDYFDFGGHRFPRKLQLFMNGISVITANVENLTKTPFDETLLVPPKDAIQRRQCADLKHAVPVKTPDPMYPPSASQSGMMGDTTVAMTILADGSVTNIQLAGSATRSMDEVTLQTLKTWKFKPAMCGTEPVVSDIEVVVSFRLH